MSVPNRWPLIDFRSVGRIYESEGGGDTNPSLALAEVSLRIDRGEFVCVTGPSGSGKSTFVHILGCLDRATIGTYRLNGRDVGVLSDDALASIRRQHVGFVFQSQNLIDTASVMANIELPAAYAGIARSARSQRATELLASLGISHRAEHLPTELSGGERQRVAIARALMNSPQMLLFDEPTAALDPEQGRMIVAALNDLAATDRTVVMVSHDPSVIARADRLVELVDGRVVADTRVKHRRSTAPTEVPDRIDPRCISVAGHAIRDGWGSLRARPWRSILAMVGVALGIWVVTVAVGLAEGAYRQSAERLARIGADMIAVRGATDDPNVEPVRLSQDDAQAMAKGVANVSRTTPRLSKRMWIEYRDKRLHANVTASTEARPIAGDGIAWPLAKGVFLDGVDNPPAQVAVIGPTLQRGLFGEVDPLGEQVAIQGLPFEVIGVLAAHPSNAELKDVPPALRAGLLASMESIVHVPFTTARELLFGADGVDLITVVVTNPLYLEQTAAAVRDLLIRRHGREGFLMQHSAELLAAYREAGEQRSLVVGVIGGVALLVGGTGVMVLMLTSIKERTREVGIRMAVGARRRDIERQFLFEAMTVSVAGGVLGITLWLVSAPFLAAFLTTPVDFAGWFVLPAVASAALAGIGFGVLPARRASGLDPVAALSDE